MKEEMAAPTVIKIGNDTFTVLTHEDNIVGLGAYGNVYLGSDNFKRNVAAKRIDRERVADPEALSSAVNNLLHLDHKNVVKVFGSENKQNACWVVMEYCPIGNLMKLFREAELTFGQKLKIMTEISQGVEYLHERNVTHRNIKPQNILISDGSHTVKITDFGFSQFLDHQVETAVVTSTEGTLAYKAPEYFELDEQGQIYYDENVDIFSSSMIFLAMLQYKPGSRVLVPHIEAPHVYTSRRILSIGQIVAERLSSKKPRLNLVHNKYQSSLSASIGAAVVALSSLVAATTHDGPCSNVAFTISAFTGTIGIGTTAIGTVGAYGSKSVAKLVGLFVGIYALAMVIGLRVAGGVTSGVDAVRVEPFSYYNTIVSMLSGACSALVPVAASIVGDLAFGLPIGEAIDTHRANAREANLLVLAAALGSTLGAASCVAGAQINTAFGVGIGALSGCLGAAVVNRNALSSLAGGAAVGAVFGSGLGIKAVVAGLAAGVLVGGVAHLSSRLLAAVLPSNNFHRQNSVSNLARSFCTTTVSALFTGVSVTAGAISSGANVSLGAIGASAGVTAALNIAAYVMGGRKAESPFVSTNTDNTISMRQKRCEMRKLIQKMASAQPKDRPSASEVVQRLKTIRNLAL